MELSVEALCNLLAKKKLLDGATIKALRQRWLAEAKGDAADTEKFGKWLVASHLLTEFQWGLLAKGSADMLLFDEYVLQDRIGKGRMAGVYKAVHSSGQQVAIKVLPPSKASNPQLLARFQREARMAIRLDHPNVVRTFQQGKAKNGMNFIVMELLEGETLEDVLKRRKSISPVEAVQIGTQILEGLQHVFEEGLVHRDVKPGNIILLPAKKGSADSTLGATVKLLDIGLGRALFDEGVPGAADNLDLTTEGSILGTPNYMAPEQARNPRSADIRADVYSVGCLLYEVFTGAAPFVDPNFMKQILRHATEPPRPIRQINPDVPEELWQVIETMLAKDPAQRYSTPSQAARALKGSIPAAPEPPKPTEPTPKMRTFLTWLATTEKTTEDKNGDVPTPPAPPTAPASLKPSAASASPVPQIPPEKKPVSAPPPAAIPSSPLSQAPPPPPPEKRAVSTPPPAAALPAVIPPPGAKPSSEKLGTPHKLPLTTPWPETLKSVPVSPGSVPLPKAVPVPPGKPGALPPILPSPPAPPLPGAKTLFQLGPISITHRDLIVTGLAVGVLLVLEFFLWLIVRLFGG